jgi:hypothetical protein
MTLLERTTVTRVTWWGFGLALVLAGYTTWLFVLSQIVWSQGLPHDYDTAATMSAEALTLAGATVGGAVVGPVLFIVSLVCLVRPRRRSKQDSGVRVLGGPLLIASLLFGSIALRTWLGFGGS